MSKLSRILGAGITFFWGKWFFGVIPSIIPYGGEANKIIGVFGKPLGLRPLGSKLTKREKSSITQEEIDTVHALYKKEIKRLFDDYKGLHPKYKDKELIMA